MCTRFHFCLHSLLFSTDVFIGNQRCDVIEYRSTDSVLTCVTRRSPVVDMLTSDLTLPLKVQISSIEKVFGANVASVFSSFFFCIEISSRVFSNLLFHACWALHHLTCFGHDLNLECSDSFIRSSKLIAEWVCSVRHVVQLRLLREWLN